VALAVLALGLLVRYHLAGMDERFFHASLHGAEGLVRYTVGDYAGAARAYRAHYSTGYEPLPGLPSVPSPSDKKSGAKPPDVQGLLAEGEAALAPNDLDRAREIYAQVLALDTDQYDALLLTAVIESKRGRYGEAVGALNRALRYGRTETRIATFLTVLETTGDLGQLPAGARPLCLLAHYHRYLRIYDHAQAGGAIRYAEAAIAARDHADDCWFTLAMVYRRQDKPHASLEALRKAIGLNPRHAGALHAAGNIYQERGDLLNERPMRDRAFASAPNDVFYAEPLLDLLIVRAGDYREAVAVAETIRTLQPQNAVATGQLGEAYMLLGEYALAERYLREALASDSRMVRTHYALAWTLLQQRKYDDAITEYKVSIALDPFEVGPYLPLASLYQRQRRYEEVVKVLTQAIYLGHQDANLYVLLCSAYSELRAVREYDACVSALLARYTGGIIGLPSVPEAMRTRGLPLPIR
jgi:tetratricopeptide (TPR) repeat protein